MSKGGALGRHFARFKCAKCEQKFRSKRALNSHVVAKGHKRKRSLEESKWVGRQQHDNPLQLQSIS